MREFSQLIASDVDRDGLGLELWEGDEQVAEIFRWDGKRELTISIWKQDLPLETIEGFIADARNRLLPRRTEFTLQRDETK